MRSRIINSLLAAAAMLPGIAQAQDERGNWQQRRSEMRQARENARGEGRIASPSERPQFASPRQDQRAQERPQFDRPQRSADDGRWRRPEAGQFQRIDPPRAQAPQQGRPDWQAGRGDRPNGWQGNPGNRPDGQPGRWQSNRGQPDRVQSDRGQPNRWQSDRGNRPTFNGGDRRRQDWARRQQFQRNGNDWNDNFRGDNRFADRSDWNNRGWNRGWRNDNRYDWNRWRGADRNRFHLPRYYAPYGWDRGYRRFSVGITLSSVLFAQNYWIDDVDDYRLPPAYGPYRWVRYYNDALLVDIRYGTVVDTVYDIFW